MSDAVQPTPTVPDLIATWQVASLALGRLQQQALALWRHDTTLPWLIVAVHASEASKALDAARAHLPREGQR